MPLFRKPNHEDARGEPPLSEDLDAVRRTVTEASLPETVREVLFRELDRLGKIHPDSTEYTIGITYIDYLLSMPWGIRTEDRLDLQRAREILDEDHHGLSALKERILEYLAVRILRTQRSFRLLVVDDEEVARKNLRHILSREGYEVNTAANGAEALNVVQTKPLDLIITDLKMDKVDGLSLLNRVKEMHPDLAVIMITGYATVDSAVSAMKKGASDYISKPFQLDEVRRAVSRALESKRLEQEAKGPILCFVGPPGTGKTSLGRSIARAMERRFVRISLAGMRDEAEIRGHRRTYAGALPGRIIQEIRRIECINPVFMMDEVDKLGQEFKGDPASALLEVLDPQQNQRFVDHYLDVPFDLSKTMFILTANITDPIPAALLDRMEVLELPGYTDDEKLEIAKRYLVPREVEENGLADFPPRFTDEALLRIIRQYTREAGLRNLEREIAAVCRRIAKDFVEAGAERESVQVDAELVTRFLGPRRYVHETAEAKDRIGVTTGLVWRESGGDIVFIEATMMKGTNQLILTGSLGDVMRESAQAALSYIRSHAERYGIPEDRFQGRDIHIHMPAGAIPKDGPSAGSTIAMALLSLFTGRPARRKVAITGELTLTGRILPIAGLREKLLAASRAGIERVVLPRKNQVDIEVLPEEIRGGLELHLIDSLDEVIELVLCPPETEDRGSAGRADGDGVP